MKIDKEVLKQWNDLKDYGDLTKIAEKSGITNETIGNAFTDEECSETTFNAIAEFFKAKKERIANATK